MKNQKTKKKNSKNKKKPKDEDKKEKKEKKLSPREKSELYGIEVKALDQLHRAYYMKETVLLGGNKQIVKPKDKIFDVLSKKI